MAHEAEAAPLPPDSGLADALADGYATVHELETRSLQLKRHCEALVAAGADATVPLAEARAVAARLGARPLLRELERL